MTHNRRADEIYALRREFNPPDIRVTSSSVLTESGDIDLTFSSDDLRTHNLQIYGDRYF
jgi:hypothetical protein